MTEAVSEYPGPTGPVSPSPTSQCPNKRWDKRWISAVTKTEIERLLLTGLTVRCVVLSMQTSIGTVARCRKKLVRLGLVPADKRLMPEPIKPVKRGTPRNPAARLVRPNVYRSESGFLNSIPLTRLMAGR